jgi:hypothetical protein
MSEMYVGRYHVRDASMSMDARDEARMTKIATFHPGGGMFSAAHDDDGLHIMSHTDERGQPARRYGEQGSGVSSSIGDARPRPRAARGEPERRPAHTRGIERSTRGALRPAPALANHSTSGGTSASQ